MNRKWLSPIRLHAPVHPKYWRSLRSLHAWLLLSFLIIPFVTAGIKNWPLYLFVPLGLYFLVVLLVPALRHTIPPLPRGRFDLNILGWILAAAIISIAFLAAWFMTFPFDASRTVAQMPKNISLLVMALLLALAAILNSLFEEIVWRGIIYGAMRPAFGPTLTVILQALLFGIWHWHFMLPRWIGVILTGAYGLYFGILRHRARGLLAPIVAHILVDLSLAAMVIAQELKNLYLQ